VGVTSTDCAADDSICRPSDVTIGDERPECRIPYVNLAAQHTQLLGDILGAIEGVLRRADFILGDDVGCFEQEFAELCQARFAVAVNSGTDALSMALRVLGVGPGDEVITVPNSFVATTSAIVMAGARPVFVDVGADYNLDPAQLAGAMTARTKAIVPVHLTGRPADMDAIMAVAKARGVAVVEDAAQAVLAEYRGRRVGSIGTISCFSLHPLKTLGACGDAGIITTQDERLHRELVLLRNLGLETRDDSVRWSGNSRLDTLQAAVLRVKAPHVWGWTERRRAHAVGYRSRLDGVAEVELPADRPYERATYHTFVLQAERRDALREHLTRRGIGTAIHYPIPIHLQHVGRTLGYERGAFPVAERQAKRILSLPVYPELGATELDYIGDSIRAFYGR
jgi:dTDP-4-amino-4,6-dideoxygalactose transaminase